MDPVTITAVTGIILALADRLAKWTALRQKLERGEHVTPEEMAALKAESAETDRRVINKLDAIIAGGGRRPSVPSIDKPAVARLEEDGGPSDV